MAAIQDFVLRIKTEGINQLNTIRKGVDGLTSDLQNLSSVGGPLSNTIGGIVNKLGPLALGATAAAGAFTILGLRALALADELSDVSDATGISAGALNNFKNSLVDAGGEAADFSTLATKLNQNLGDAAVGNETAQKAFQKLGVFVRDAGGKVRDTGDVLRDAISKLAAIEDPAIRAALAVDIFGKSANKLDFKQLNAANDPFKDEQVKQLQKYQTAIDSLAKTINDQLITSFGGLAKSISGFLEEYNSQGFDAFINRLTVASLRLSGFGNEADKAREKFKADIKAKAETDVETQKLLRLSQTPNAPAFKMPAKQKGDFGATPEATLKAIAESRKRAAQDTADAEKEIELKAANDIEKINVEMRANIAKAQLEITSKERISEVDKAKETLAMVAKFTEKANTDIAKVKSQLNAKIFSEEEAQRQKTREEQAAEETRLNKLFEAGRKITENAAEQNRELSDRAKLILDSAMMTDRERANAEELFKIEQDRLALLKQIKDTYGDEEFAKRTAEEKKINDLLNKRRNNALVAQNEQKLQREDFNLGWEKSYRQYIENSTNAAQQGQQAFETLSRGFEDAFTRMFRSGEASFKNLKLGFKDLANSMIADFVRIQAQTAFKSIFGALFGGVGSITANPFRATDLAGGSVLGLPGYASGGNIPAGQLSMVGERGPELFLPKQAGTIIPNNMLGGGQTNNTAVTYNIQAVDASSFRSLVARDPEFIHNVAEQGRRQLPIRSRR